MRPVILVFILLTCTVFALAQPLQFNFVVPASPLQAYNAFTTDWQLQQWSGARGGIFDARPSGIWRLLYGATGVQQGVVQSAAHGENLIYTQIFFDNETLVSIAFKPDSLGTRIRIIHEPPASGGTPGLVDSMEGYWQRFLPLVRSYLTDNPGGYLARPRIEKPAGLVLVLHDRFGLNRTTRAWCDSLADQGYLALAPDMFRGEVTSDQTQAGRYLDAVRADDALTAAARGLATLRAGFTDKPCAVWGIGFGALHALELATRNPDLRGCIVWQDAALPPPDRLSRIAAPVLAVFGDPDETNPRPEILSHNQAFQQAGVRIETMVYRGGAHYSDPAYAEAYSDLAVQRGWQKTMAFLTSNMR